MVFTIVCTQANVTQNGFNNQLVYSFPNSVLFDNHEIALASASMFYSWYNIDQTTLQNSTFYYWWMDSTGTYVQYPVVLPTGIYEISTINDYLQFTMINNGHFSVDSLTGNNVYYLNMILNSTLYAVEAQTALVESLATDYPTNIIPKFSLPASAFKQFQFPPNFNAIVGFVNVPGWTNNTSPQSTAPSQVFQSNVAPQVQPNPTLLLQCTGINNPYASPATNVYALTPTVAVGGQIAEKPPQYAWAKLNKGTYASLTFRWTTASGGNIQIADPNQTVVFVIRDCSQDTIDISGKQS